MNTPIEKTQRRVAPIQRTRQNDRWFRLCIILFLLLVFGHTPRSAEGIEHPDGIYLSGDRTFLGDSNRGIDIAIRKALQNYRPTNSYQELKILYPYNDSIFPPEIAAPTFEWADGNDDRAQWLVMVTFDGRHKPFYILFDSTRWTPRKEIWESIKEYSIQGPALITVLGLNSGPKPGVFSKGAITLTTSRDPVGAPLMFRRVPPNFAYAAKHPEKMQWVLGDIASYEDPPVIMSKQPVCASCHTFSQNGRWVGMDMDYNKDKGAYVLTTVRQDIILTDQDFVTWNDFPRTDGLQSTGLYSRLSPDGNFVASTVNEIFFLIKISDPYFSQLFFPLQGSLAIYSGRTRKIAPISGADLPDFVQTDPSWSPDGSHLLYSRAPVQLDLFWDLGGQTVFSAEKDADVRSLRRQYPIQFDIYRIPFNHGKGGPAIPLAGASHNGKSNYYPRYSPNGQWIVFTQSETGLAIQPDSKLFIIPATGREARMMACNLNRMNSWHTWSPNSRWLAFVSKENTPFTELFLTHIDERGMDSPPILLSRFNKSGYAINVPEFVNIPSEGIKTISIESN
jgi:hypothetical protein